MTFPKLDEDLFNQTTATLRATLRNAKLYDYQKRAISYEIDRRDKANTAFHTYKSKVTAKQTRY